MRRTLAGARGLRALARNAVRALVLVLCVQLPATALSGLIPSARADEMMLADEQKPFTKSGWGWMFVGLGLVAAGVAANDYQETEYYVKKAKDAYANYVAAGPTTVTYYRDLTTTYDHRALAYESSANAAAFLGVAFLATAIAIFRSSDKDDTPILLSDRGVQWTYKF